MQTVTLIVFCVTVLPLIFTPGPDIIYISTRGIAQGRQAALISTLGLTALVYASEMLFSLVRYAGAAYLLYLGIKAIRSKSQIEFNADKRLLSNRHMFLTGVATSVMNPKGILLFFSYFPQFVVPEAGNVMVQLFVIGTRFTVMCGLVYSAYGLFSGAIGERLSTTPRIADLMKWLTGSVMIGLGLRLALPAGERVMARFRALATPLADLLRPMKYPEIYPPEEGSYHPVAASRTMFVDRIDRSVAETILNHLEASTGSLAVAQLRVLGGAMARVSADATAFAHRSSRIMLNLAALYEKPEEKTTHESWVRNFSDALQQSDGGAYVNFLGEEGDERVRAAYPESTWDRLMSIKARYDPTNLFRLNQNIPPADQ